MLDVVVVVVVGGVLDLSGSLGGQRAVLEYRQHGAIESDSDHEHALAAALPSYPEALRPNHL